jgi:preprotein translocase subunit SecB
MSSDGIRAQFDFISYKIDYITLNMNPIIYYLQKNDPIVLKSTHFEIKLRNTEKFNINGLIRYIGGLAIKITVMDEEDKKEILTGEFGISGIFSPNGDVDQSLEENFAKVNLPAILMPYLRALMIMFSPRPDLVRFYFPW